MIIEAFAIAMLEGRLETVRGKSILRSEYITYSRQSGGNKCA